ncbi:MAG TPA: hypothetical protein DCY88_00420 [Cyanobacteria bacterium UBA11372]|nr:hypothetical protein [Cyanobacteria bacterium UBA11372]
MNEPGSRGAGEQGSRGDGEMGRWGDGECDHSQVRSTRSIASRIWQRYEEENCFLLESPSSYHGVSPPPHVRCVPASGASSSSSCIVTLKKV